MESIRWSRQKPWDDWHDLVTPPMICPLCGLKAVYRARYAEGGTMHSDARRVDGLMWCYGKLEVAESLDLAVDS